jgi:hypothetical protein
MSGLKIKALTALRLGLTSISRLVFYKLGLKTGLNAVRRLQANVPEAPFFRQRSSARTPRAPVRRGWYDHAEAFGQRLQPLDQAPPEWLFGCFSGKAVDVADRNWWQIPDFDPAVGDIKTVWEASRFDWALACAQHHLAGDTEALPRLENWLADWLLHNPPYKGPNWKCGQEASIRVMHLAMTAHLLGEVGAPTSSLLVLIELHLKRIAPTLQYAIAQDNNHGTSEAAALFIGGSWLAQNNVRSGAAWASKGRRWLENRVARLIQVDGSFSQYSLNYHRVMLDTLSMAELWRSSLDMQAFTERFYERAKAATEWLRSMTLVASGDGPNLGANDGARLLPLTDTDYRDHRPSVQLAAVVFLHARAFEQEGSWNHPLAWLRVELPQAVLPAVGSRQFDQGGYTVMRADQAMVMLRYPRFRFRPSQADALHLDLWISGENWLRDAGSYSYNTDPQWLAYFPGTAAHNTVQFDGRDQMPRLSRFLFGDWLKTDYLEPLRTDQEKQVFAAGYTDRQRASHRRSVLLQPGKLEVTDQISGFRECAVLRWRLRPGDWTLDAETVTVSSAEFCLRIASSVPVRRFELVEGWESRYYLQKTPLPVLEVEVDQAAELVSIFEWITK